MIADGSLTPRKILLPVHLIARAST
jgi:hypothetical protein